jgi:hypothetical protein
MHATLTFNLPDEKDDLLMAAGKCWDWYGVVRAVVRAVKQELRDRRKYKCEETVDIEELESFIYDELEERGLTGDV